MEYNNRVDDQRLSELKVVEEEEFHEENYRWVILVIFSLLNFANGFSWLTYTVLNTEFTTEFNFSNGQNYFFNYIFMIGIVVFLYPAFYVAEYVSIRIGLNIASILTLIGTLLKSFIISDLWYAYIGQSLCAIGSPFVGICVGKIGALWFRPARRVIAVSICALANTAGVLLNWLLNEVGFKKNYTSVASFNHDFVRYLWINFGVVVFCCVPILFLFRSKPVNPPSMSQKIRNQLTTLESIKSIFTNKDYIIFLIFYNAANGYWTLMSGISSTYFAIYSLTNKQISLMNNLSNATGIIAGLVIAIYNDKFKNYRFIYLVISCVILIAHVLMMIFLPVLANSFVAVTICYLIVMSGIMAIYAIGMDYACEVTYPVGESISVGFTTGTSQAVCFFLQYFVGKWVSHMKNDSNHKYGPNLLFLILLVIELASAYLLSKKLLRNKVDTKDNQIDIK